MADAAMSAGSILQVVQSTKDDEWTESLTSGSTSSAITGLSTSITPANGSKVLIIAQLSIHNGVEAGGNVLIKRVTSAIFVGDGGGSSWPAMSSALGEPQTKINHTVPLICLDDPSANGSTSFTYNFHHLNGASSTRTVRVNRASSDVISNTSQVILMEVAQ